MPACVMIGMMRIWGFPRMRRMAGRRIGIGATFSSLERGFLIFLWEGVMIVRVEFIDFENWKGNA